MLLDFFFFFKIHFLNILGTMARLKDEKRGHKGPAFDLLDFIIFFKALEFVLSENFLTIFKFILKNIRDYLIIEYVCDFLGNID